MDALSLAGDLTIYGVRSDVKVIREENGVRTTASLDLTSQDIYDSPYFYLQQNDVIYVKPNEYRAQAGEISQNRSFYISLISTAVSVATLIVTLTRQFSQQGMTPNNINPNSANSDTKQEEHITFSVHDLIQTVIANWYWFVISVFVCVGCGYIYILRTPKIYGRTANILVKDSRKGGDTDLATLSDLAGLSQRRNVDNEIVFSNRAA